MNGSSFSIVNAYMMQQNNSCSTLVLIVPLLIKYICYYIKLKQNAFHTTYDICIIITYNIYRSIDQLKVAFNNAFRMMHNLPTYCSASEMFTVNRVADCKAVIRNLVHRFMMRLTISKHLLVRSILSSDLLCSSRIRRHWARLLYVHYHGG